MLIQYDVYDLCDLGEFDQKGQVDTKWGSKQDLLSLSEKAKDLSVLLYCTTSWLTSVVPRLLTFSQSMQCWITRRMIFNISRNTCAYSNHRAADELEKCRVQEVDDNNRNRAVSDPYEINTWLGFTFPGRKEMYSSMKYVSVLLRSQCMLISYSTGTILLAQITTMTIRRRRFVLCAHFSSYVRWCLQDKILGDGNKWTTVGVDKEKGNYDYLMVHPIRSALHNI